MTFYTSPFGNGVVTGSGGNVVENVHNQFGPRGPDYEGFMGVHKIEGMKEELVILLTGHMFNDVADTLMPFVLPAGAVIKDVFIDVVDAFVLTSDTTPALEVGTATTEATNGFTVTEAQLEATNTVNLTSALSGTWDAEAPLAADTEVSIVLSGTNSAMTDAGKAYIRIHFIRTELTPSPAEYA